MDVYSNLRGPKRAWFGQYDHVRGNESKVVGRNGFMDEAMHRLGLFMSGSDESWFSPIPTMSTVSIEGGALELPFLRYERPSNLPGRPAEAMSDVPTIEVPKSLVGANTTTVKFPPRLERR